jgi:serine/threonine protein kinase
MGTFDYMAPEQVENARNAVKQSDIYSLRHLLYILLTGNSLTHYGKRLLPRRNFNPL